MLVAVLSDVHDHVTRLLTALAHAQAAGCTHLFFTGDAAALSTFRLMAEEWPHGMDAVFGNNEWERTAFARFAQGCKGVHLHGDEAEVLLDGRRIYLCHYPHMAAKAAAGGGYDAAFYGHSHCAESTMVGTCLLANAGEVCGERYGIPSIGLYNTADNSFTLQRI